MTHTQAETCRQIADIIDFEPDRFEMNKWMSDCGTTACIAGHIGLLNNESFLNLEHGALAISKWTERQAQRLGLDKTAGAHLFESGYFSDMTNSELSNVLRYLAKEVEENEEQHLLHSLELRHIADKALPDISKLADAHPICESCLSAHNKT